MTESILSARSRSITRTAFALAAVPLLLFLAGGAPKEGIPWEPSFAEALERARQEGLPVMVAVNMDGEAVCEELTGTHYRLDTIVDLSGRMVCLFASRYYHRDGDKVCPRAGRIPCANHQQVEKDLRNHLPEIADEQGNVIAPTHLFLGPDGKLLFSVPYMVTPGELEWCMVEAIRKVTPSFKWNLSASARAPRRIRYDGVAGAADRGAGGGRGNRAAAPLSDEELGEVLDLLKKADRRERGRTAREYLSSLILTDDPRAVDAVKMWLAAPWVQRGQQGRNLLRQIGNSAPGIYWEVVAPFVSHEDPAVRNEAAVALEQLAEPKSLKVLTKQCSGEKVDEVKANLIRAIASVGRANRSAASQVLKTAERDKSAFLRINAIVGLAYVEDRKKVNAVLEKALQDDEIGVRAAAAYAIAVRREQDLRAVLELAEDSEQDPDCKHCMKGALSVLKGTDLRAVEGVLEKYALQDIPRERE